MEELGILKVLLVEAKNLRDVQTLGKQDPYATVALGNSKAEKTKVHQDGGKMAKWNQEFTFKVTAKQQVLSIAVLNRNVMNDDVIGRAFIEADTLINQGGQEKWFQLGRPNRMDKPAGEVLIRTHWLPRVSQPVEVEQPEVVMVEAPVVAVATHVPQEIRVTGEFHGQVVQVCHSDSGLALSTRGGAVFLDRVEASSPFQQWRVLDLMDGKVALENTGDHTNLALGGGRMFTHLGRGAEALWFALLSCTALTAAGHELVGADPTKRPVSLYTAMRMPQPWDLWSIKTIQVAQPVEKAEEKAELDLTGEWRVYVEGAGVRRSCGITLKQDAACHLQYNVEGRISGGNVYWKELWQNPDLDFKQLGLAKVSPKGQVRFDADSTKAINGFPTCACMNITKSTGKWYYELELLSPGIMQLGWASVKGFEPPGIGNGVGDDDRSWGFDGSRQVAFHAGRRMQVPASKWKAGDIVGCGVDCDQGTASFWLNGKLLTSGPLFRSPALKQGVRPACSFSREDGARWRVAENTCQFLPKRFQPLLVGLLKTERITATVASADELHCKAPAGGIRRLRRVSALDRKTHPEYFLPWFNLSGAWRVYVEARGRAKSYSLFLQQDASGRLTGKGEAGNMKYTVSGTVKDNVVRYTEHWATGTDTVEAYLSATGVAFQCRTVNADLQMAKRCDALTPEEWKKFMLPYQ